MYSKLCNERLPYDGYPLYDPISDILLTVVFNIPNYSIIPLLEIILRPLFPRIIYCGYTPEDERTQQEINKYKKYKITVHTYEKPRNARSRGFSLGQICAVVSMKKVSNVKVGFTSRYYNLNHTIQIFCDKFLSTKFIYEKRLVFNTILLNIKLVMIKSNTKPFCFTGIFYHCR